MFARLGKQLLILLAVRLRRGSEWVESLLRENEKPVPDAKEATSTGGAPHRRGPPAHWLALVQQHAPELLRPAADRAPQEISTDASPTAGKPKARTLLNTVSTTDGPNRNKPRSKFSNAVKNRGKMRKMFTGEKERSVSGAGADEEPVLGTEAESCHPSAVNKYPPEKHAAGLPAENLREFPEVQAGFNPEVLQIEQTDKTSRETWYGASSAIRPDASDVSRESRTSSIASKEAVASAETEAPLSLPAERRPLFANGEAVQSGLDSNARNLPHAVHHARAEEQAAQQHGHSPEAEAGSGRSKSTAQSQPESLAVDGSSAVENHVPFAAFPSAGEDPFVERHPWPEMPDEASDTQSVEEHNNRWPALPEVSFQEVTTADVLWAVDHQAKLNREQRGEAWSGLPF